MNGPLSPVHELFDLWPSRRVVPVQDSVFAVFGELLIEVLLCFLPPLCMDATTTKGAHYYLRAMYAKPTAKPYRRESFHLGPVFDAVLLALFIVSLVGYLLS